MDGLTDTYKTIDCIPNGIVTLPPSKSVAHRAVICAALAKGTSVVDNIELSEDMSATLACVKALGIEYSYQNGRLTIKSDGLKPMQNAMLDCGESGSTLRFMIPIAMLLDKTLEMTGHGRLMQRPLSAFQQALEEHGGTIEKNGDILSVTGRLRAGTYRLSGSISSQYVTGLLFALPLLESDSIISLTSELESKAYVDLTIDMLRQFGVTIINDQYRTFTIKGNQSYTAHDLRVEGDYSAAAFLLGAGALGCDVGCDGLKEDSLQGDKAFLSILEQCGIEVVHKDGIIRAKPGVIRETVVDVKDIPDLVPPLASVLCFCEGTSKIINAGRLRIKESDRLHALTVEFNKLGAKFTEEQDALVIEGVRHLHGGTVDAHNDHRIAMALAVASIKSKEPIKLSGWTSVKKSYPAFWNDFCKVERSITNE